jgi:hypothetical protein
MLYIGDMLELNYCLDLVISKQNPSQSSNFGSFFSPKKTLCMSHIGLFFHKEKMLVLTTSSLHTTCVLQS